MQGQPRQVIAIDGPVAAGKSTVGQRVAAALDCPFIDTGLMYRGIAWLVHRQQTPASDTAAIAILAENACIEVDRDRVYVDGEDVSAQLRTAAVESLASHVARVPEVRQALVAKQRQMALRGSVVMAGRDIGTVVLQDASLKVFLSASPRERARRRYEEIAAHGGTPPSQDRILADLLERDRRDTERAISPLRPAAGAHIIETEGMSLDQVVEKILALVRADA